MNSKDNTICLPSICWLCLLCSLSVYRITSDLLPFHADSSHLTVRCTASCRMEIKSRLEQMHSVCVYVYVCVHVWKHTHPVKSSLISVLAWHPVDYLMARIITHEGHVCRISILEPRADFFAHKNKVISIWAKFEVGWRDPLTQSSNLSIFTVVPAIIN